MRLSNLFTTAAAAMLAGFTLVSSPASALSLTPAPNPIAPAQNAVPASREGSSMTVEEYANGVFQLHPHFALIRQERTRQVSRKDQLDRISFIKLFDGDGLFAFEIFVDYFPGERRIKQISIEKFLLDTNIRIDSASLEFDYGYRSQMVEKYLLKTSHGPASARLMSNADGFDLQFVTYGNGTWTRMLRGVEPWNGVEIPFVSGPSIANAS
ncbi:hypothetical protein THASP1DRAFT_25849 [Thamnocephalis sphaerospora]|uniref:Uncharacterized protein n=1 Tax=Thamnocephalis sphaerospora TaxID=78915 RepID=A0A4P9XIZ8_9FUNG|nr:hypothetical protein THASP1DRAFT_25849 [Thamnocephalis sphaerospora]|eukprot:RKP05697.1 hypothetical protein THASP1DRAFT_25849 [Thamnocephalis sphaerospora]